MQIKSLRCLVKPLQLQEKTICRSYKLVSSSYSYQMVLCCTLHMDKSMRVCSDLFVVAVTGFVVWGIAKKIMK